MLRLFHNPPGTRLPQKRAGCLSNSRAPRSAHAPKPTTTIMNTRPANSHYECGNVRGRSQGFGRRPCSQASWSELAARLTLPPPIVSHLPANCRRHPVKLKGKRAQRLVRFSAPLEISSRSARIAPPADTVASQEDQYRQPDQVGSRLD